MGHWELFLNVGGRANEDVHIKKQYDKLSEIKKSDGDKRSPLNQSGRENLRFWHSY